MRMRKKGLLLFGAGLLAGISSSFGLSHSKKAVPAVSLPLFYAGTWQYYDEERDRTHVISIGPDLKLTIDNHVIAANVEQINNEHLIYLDRLGYHITIQANESRPVALIDETDDEVYALKPLV